MSTFIDALKHVKGNELLEESIEIPTLIVVDYDAAQTLSAYINMEGGTGHIYGRFNSESYGEHWKVSYDLFEKRRSKSRSEDCEPEAE